MFSPYPGSAIFNELHNSGEIAALDDRYFDDLIVQFDFTKMKSFCRHVPGWEIAIYRFLGMIVFYGLSYALYPRRIVRLVRTWKKADFRPRSLFLAYPVYTHTH